MRNKGLALALVLLFAVLLFVHPATAWAKTADLAEGTYTIQSKAGGYLTSPNDLLCVADKSEQWYLQKAKNGALYAYAESGKLLDLNNDWDSDGNTVGVFSDTGYLTAQTWKFTQNDDGTYRIQTVHKSGRVVTSNGEKQPTLQSYKALDTQKWVLARVDVPVGGVDEPEEYAGYRRILKSVNGFDTADIVIHRAEGQTDKSLKAKLAENPKKHNMIEGKYVVLHFTNSVWAKYSNPKELIDAFDYIYKTQLDLIGGTAQVYSPKLVFLTDLNKNVPYMYMAHGYCAFSKAAAENSETINEWKKKKYPLWGVGHEIGHAMVNLGMGGLFEGYDGESWTNILNVYCYDKRGLRSYARKLVAQYPHTYYGDNSKYGKYEGKDYDKLSDTQRSAAILEANTHIFVKLPMLLIDNHGWDGMKKFFTKAANDHAGGMNASSNVQDRIDYMVVNLSQAYGMDLSALFDYWKVSPSSSARSQTSGLPAEKKIAASYGLK